MTLLKFWSAFLFYSFVSIIIIALIWEPNLTGLPKSSANFDWYFTVFIVLFCLLDSIFERLTITPEEREGIHKKMNLPLTKNQIIVLFLGLAVFIIIAPFGMNYLIGLYRWFTETIYQNTRGLILAFLIVLFWLIKTKRLWNNYYAIKSNHTTVS